MDPRVWKLETRQRERVVTVISISRLDGPSESIFPDQKTQSITNLLYFHLQPLTKILLLTLFKKIYDTLCVKTQGQ